MWYGTCVDCDEAVGVAQREHEVASHRGARPDLIAFHSASIGPLSTDLRWLKSQFRVSDYLNPGPTTHGEPAQSHGSSLGVVKQ